MSLRWLLLPVLLLPAAGAVELSAGSLSMRLDDHGQVQELSLEDRPTASFTGGLFQFRDEAGPRQTAFYGLDSVWPADNTWQFRGPQWRPGLSWQLVPDGYQGHPLARLTLTQPTHSDALRLTIPTTPQAVMQVRLQLRTTGFQGIPRLGMVAANTLGRATTTWQPFEGAVLGQPDGTWFTVTCQLSPPPTSTLLDLWVAAEQATGTLEVGGAEVTACLPGARVAVDGRMTATARGARYEGEGGGLAVAAEFTNGARAIRVHATVTARGDADRAVTLFFRVPLDATGWNWWNDLESFGLVGGGTGTTGRGAAATPQFHGNWRPLRGGHSYSPWPIGCLTRAAPAQGVALAAPLSQPVLTRYFYRPRDGLNAGFELGFAPRLDRRTATLDFAIYPVDATWGMRSALDHYYGVYEQDVTRTTPRAGAWFSGLNPAATPRPQRFGLMFDEQAASHLAWTRANNFVALSSLMPWGLWSKAGPATAVNAGGLYPVRAVGPDSVPPGGELRDVDGRPIGWRAADGTLFQPWSTEPRLLPNGPIGRINTELVAALQAPDARPLDGLHLDGIGAAWAGWQLEDFADDHLRSADVPLTASRVTGRPALYSALEHVPFLRNLSGRLRGRGQVILGGLDDQTPLPFVLPWLDVLGAGESTPTSDYLMWLRAFAYHKPITFLDPTLLDPNLLLEDEQGLWQRSVLYGAFPGAAGWLSQQNVDQHAPLFDVYLPILRDLASSGWEPIPYAVVNDASIKLERFGYRDDLYLVLINPTPADRTVTLTLQPLDLGLITTAPDGTPERRLLFVNRLSRTKRAIEFRTALDRWQATVTLGPRAMAVLTPYKIDSGLDVLTGLPGLG